MAVNPLYAEINRLRKAVKEKNAYIDKMHGHFLKFSHRCHARMIATIKDRDEQIVSLKSENKRLREALVQVKACFDTSQPSLKQAEPGGGE